ncbi:MAG: alpha/beta fold hydrolase [Chloroflexi bacterium]|nr:MAG: alpha/beta fold hydrolase [Chloroflexota bacterium]
MKRWWTSLFFLLLILAMLPALVVIGAALFLARMMTRPRRLPLWHTPRDVGLDYEAVHFDSDDGLYLDGWFIPAPGDGPRPAVVIAHGWPWNRAGTPAQDFFARLTQSPPIDLLRPAQALHQAGFHVLMFDFRNHGLSGSVPYLTFGRDEAADLMGAVRYLRQRPDVDPARVGVLGFSMGGNAVVFACARDEEQAIRAAVAVQPVRPSVFAPRFAATLLGPLAEPTLRLALRLYHRAGGPLLEEVDPTLVGDLVSTPILYLQGNGDPWGTVRDVRRLYEQATGPKQLKIVPTQDRYGGYLYLGDHPEEMVAFFQEHL